MKNKEDALYSLLNYLLDQIMGKDVSQSFLEPINDEIAPGNLNDHILIHKNIFPKSVIHL